jgi:hypothetical protein
MFHDPPRLSSDSSHFLPAVPQAAVSCPLLANRDICMTPRRAMGAPAPPVPTPAARPKRMALSNAMAHALQRHPRIPDISAPVAPPEQILAARLTPAPMTAMAPVLRPPRPIPLATAAPAPRPLTPAASATPAPSSVAVPARLRPLQTPVAPLPPLSPLTLPVALPALLTPARSLLLPGPPPTPPPAPRPEDSPRAEPRAAVCR